MKRFAVLITLVVFAAGCVHGKLEVNKPDLKWTTGEVACIGVMALGQIGDGVSTHNVLSRGGYELNPILGEHPSDGKLIAWKVATSAFILLIAHVAPSIDQKWGRRLRKALLLSTGATGGYCTYHNYNVLKDMEKK